LPSGQDEKVCALRSISEHVLTGHGMGRISVGAVVGAVRVWKSTYDSNGTPSEMGGVKRIPRQAVVLKEASNYIKFLEEYEKNRKGVTIKKQKHAARTKVFMEYDKHTSIVSPACLPAMVDPRPKFRE